MLSIGLISLLIAVPLFSYRITPSLFNRITTIILIYSSLLAYNSMYIECLESGVGIYSGLFQVNVISIGIESFLLLIGAFIMIGWGPVSPVTPIINNSTNTCKAKKLSFLYNGEYNINTISQTNEIINNAFSTESEKHNTINNIIYSFYSDKSEMICPKYSEYSLIIIFTTIGASLLVSSYDLVSIYLSIELQSFAVYVIATLYRNSESATAAGLKYFLLGGLSSALILLGTALIYTNIGVTHFESIYSLVSVIVDGINNEYSLIFGIILIGIGFIFKVSAAPFHNWAPDVYSGVPTIVTSWLTTIPKISIFIFLLELIIGIEGKFEFMSVIKNILLSVALFSLIVGTIVGLSQYRIKRLLAYSTISHVGFLLLALAVNTEESVESFLFYIIQYSITNINTFLIILAFGYTINTIKISIKKYDIPTLSLINKINNKINILQFGIIKTIPKEKQEFFEDKCNNINFTTIKNKQIHTILNSTTDINFINNLKGQFHENPILTFSLALCLFSIAGIPPIIGFFAKQIVLYSSTHAGYFFISIVAIIVSVISASYYLKIIATIYFEDVTKIPITSFSCSAAQKNYSPSIEHYVQNNSVIVEKSKGSFGVTTDIPTEANIIKFYNSTQSISNVHSIIIATITTIITLFVLQPSILLNCCHLLALCIFYY